MENKKLFDLVKDALGDCERSDIVDAWNEICSEDDEIHSMSDFDDVCDDFNDLCPTDIIGHVRNNFDDFDFCNDFFYVDCGSYYSTDDPYDKVDIDQLINAILEEEVEVDGIDLDELKKACAGELRAFKDAFEFKKVTCCMLDNVVTMRRKSNGEIREGLISEFRTIDDRATVCLGAGLYNMDDLFKNYEFEKNGEWLPFGIADETKDSDNED